MQGAANPHTPMRQGSAGIADSPVGCRDALDRIRAHKARCRRMPASTPSESERLVAQFLVKRSGITPCPAAYAAPVRWRRVRSRSPALPWSAALDARDLDLAYLTHQAGRSESCYSATMSPGSVVLSPPDAADAPLAPAF